MYSWWWIAAQSVAEIIHCLRDRRHGKGCCKDICTSCNGLGTISKSLVDLSNILKEAAKILPEWTFFRNRISQLADDSIWINIEIFHYGYNKEQDSLPRFE